MKKNGLTLTFSIIGAFLTGILGTYLVVTNNPTITKNIVENVNKVEIKENSIADSVDKIYNSVVTVIAYKNDTKFSSGTGFVYKKENGKGYIMTNNHVVNGADKVEVTLSDNEVVDATSFSGETFSDIAVLTIPEDKVLMVAEIGKSSDLRIGDTLFAVGTPIGINYSSTVTKGILSGKDRLMSVSLTGSNTSDWIMKVLQTDAAINPGNSGGPLANINGEVIGITSLKLVTEQIEGMGFAIPIEDALYYADILESGGIVERPFAGIGMLDLSESYYLWASGIVVDSSIKTGVVVSEVEEGSPAFKGGLQKGDVIVKVASEDIDSKAKFRYALYMHKPGDTIEIKYYRGKDLKTTKITLGVSNS